MPEVVDLQAEKERRGLVNHGNGAPEAVAEFWAEHFEGSDANGAADYFLIWLWSNGFKVEPLEPWN